MPNVAQERRLDAIRALMDETISRKTGKFLHDGVITDDMIEEFASKIVDRLPMLGRTEHWKNACRTWAYLVREARMQETYEERYHYFHWAVIQGCVQLSYAA
jgi:ADP-dependent phosphofructokinase/glucokinase